MKAIVIDPVFPVFLNKEYYVDSTFSRLNKSGLWYRLKENKDDVLCSYFGENQIKIIEEGKTRVPHDIFDSNNIGKLKPWMKK